MDFVSETQYQIKLKNGGFMTTSHPIELSGNFIIFTEKDIIGDKLVITKRPIKFEDVDKFVTIQPAERRQIPPDLQEGETLSA